ncbi:MAG: M24 family metallopeptidase [Actinomycetota bacterium]
MTYPFSRAELVRRADRARALMGEHGLDALMVTGDFSAGMNYYYLSGHLPRDYQLNFSRPHVMVLPREGDPFLYVYGINEQNARETSWVEDVRPYAPPFGGTALAKLMTEHNLGETRIGAELGWEQRISMSVEDFEALRAGLPDASFVDASSLIWKLRMIKGPEEVELIRQADRINDEALRVTFSEIKSGDTEVDVARAFGAALVNAGAVRPPYGQVLIESHAKSRDLGHRSRMLGPSADHSLAPGDLLFIDSGAVVSGYWGEFNRMAVVGHPTERQTGHHDAIRRIVTRSVAEALKPGRTYRQVIEDMARYYRELGYEEEQFANYLGPPFMHLCHGIGLASSEPPFVRWDSEEVLEPGMVMSCEAYLSNEGMTYGSEEDVLITETGCEVLSNPDPGLFVLTS